MRDLMSAIPFSALTVPELLDRVNHLQISLDSAKKHYGAQLAPSFNTFDFIRPDEMRLSEILAWLLDPQKHVSHAQESTFLNLFCARYGIDWSELEINAANIKTEVIIETGRADIIVWSGVNRKLIVIENKPWAGDGKDQISRYIKWARGTGKPYHLIYLPGIGSEPSSIKPDLLEYEKNNGTFQTIPYTDLLPWLADCRKDCRADRVTAFIREFERYIEKQFKGATDMTEANEITAQIAGSPESIRAAFSIFAAEKDIKLFLLNKLADEISNILNKDYNGIDIINNTKEWWARFASITIFFNTESRYGVSLSWERTEFNCLIWGLVRRDENLDVKTDINRFGALFGKQMNSEWWPWYKYADQKDARLPLPKDWQLEPQPWEEIARGEMAINIARAAKEFKTMIKDDSLL
jgi:hypothetical protein